MDEPSTDAYREAALAELRLLPGVGRTRTAATSARRCSRAGRSSRTKSSSCRTATRPTAASGSPCAPRYRPRWVGFRAYSVHTEIPWLGPRARLEQAQAILDDAKSSDDPVVLGGDFNPRSRRHGRDGARLHLGAGYSWVSRGVGATAGSFVLDHLFSHRFRTTRSWHCFRVRRATIARSGRASSSASAEPLVAASGHGAGEIFAFVDVARRRTQIDRACEDSSWDCSVRPRSWAARATARTSPRRRSGRARASFRSTPTA